VSIGQVARIGFANVPHAVMPSQVVGAMNETLKALGLAMSETGRASFVEPGELLCRNRRSMRVIVCAPPMARDANPVQGARQ
jgi:hypothetical protein